MTKRIPVASAHGRFQPLHNEHMEYLIRAKEACDFLWIGITMPDVTVQSKPLGRERERPFSNPLTYFERATIIKAALVDSGILSNSFEFTPFPIETPASLSNFIPTDIPCLTTVCENWNREKIEVLQNCGYAVRVLFERAQKQITGSAIRQFIVDGADEEWEKLVPVSTVKYLKEIGIKSRLEKLRSHPIL